MDEVVRYGRLWSNEELREVLRSEDCFIVVMRGHQAVDRAMTGNLARHSKKICFRVGGWSEAAHRSALASVYVPVQDIHQSTVIRAVDRQRRRSSTG